MTIKDLTIAQRVKMFREVNKLSQEALGEKINVSAKTISAWETGEREINLNNLKYLSEFFNIPEPFLLYGLEEDKLSKEQKEKISKYLTNRKDEELRNRLYLNCQKVIEKNNIKFSKDYLPEFDIDEDEFSDGGIFILENLPFRDGKIDEKIVDDLSYYKFDIEGLIINDLYDIVKRYFSETIVLTDLYESNDPELLAIALENVRNNRKKEKPNYNPFGENTSYEYSDEYTQNQLNQLLENLSPYIDNYWHFIVLLIDEGAFYVKQYSQAVLDSCCVNECEDISKTNLVYRIALDKINEETNNSD